MWGLLIVLVGLAILLMVAAIVLLFFGYSVGALFGAAKDSWLSYKETKKPPINVVPHERISCKVGNQSFLTDDFGMVKCPLCKQIVRLGNLKPCERCGIPHCKQDRVFSPHGSGWVYCSDHCLILSIFNCTECGAKTDTAFICRNCGKEYCHHCPSFYSNCCSRECYDQRYPYVEEEEEFDD